MSRKLIILDGSWEWLSTNLPSALAHSSSLAIFSPANSQEIFHFLSAQHFTFTKAHNALGQEWDYVLYDGRNSLNLEALAISAGTVKNHGKLLLWVNDWQNYAEQLDKDALRWNDGKLKPSPNFRQFLTQLVAEFGFSVIRSPAFIPPLQPLPNSIMPEALQEQQNLLQHLLNLTYTSQQSFILTAKRGRGKSALVGMWQKKLLEQGVDWSDIVLTAPNGQAIQSLAKFADKLNFIAPDLLLSQCEQGLIHSLWLVVDEASSLPLPILQKLISYFPRHFLLTTTESYEGTGKGFELKFMQKLLRSNQTSATNWQHLAHFTHFTLEQPLRWQKNDPLEQFIERLLFSDFSQLENRKFFSKSEDNFNSYPKSKALYDLLYQAHYRTTPLDLRRLLDGDNQEFFTYTKNNLSRDLDGAIWGIFEGAIAKTAENLALLTKIQQGTRRPFGNLVAQLLNQAYLAHEACTLHSLRISRIAISPYIQRQGLGSEFLTHTVQELKNRTNDRLDFISVSFGFEKHLAHFWQKNGFKLVFISSHANASSGNFSAVALYPLNSAGEKFCQHCQTQFEQNFPLTQHPLTTLFNSTPLVQSLNAKDFTQLNYFAQYHRQFFMTLPTLVRLQQVNPLPAKLKLAQYLSQLTPDNFTQTLPNKTQLKEFREEVKALLAK